MSNIGCKPINIQGLNVEVEGSGVRYKGPKGSGVYALPSELVAKIDGANLLITLHDMAKKSNRSLKMVWGLHRALLASKLSGALQEFERKIQINGLGYKAVKSATGLVFSLGYSHKIDFELPKEVSVDIDKTGQNLTLKSSDKELVGHVCSQIRYLRPPEPYKGTGIRVGGDKGLEEIARKAGKTKAS